MTSLNDLNNGIVTQKAWLNPVCNNISCNNINCKNIYGVNNFSIIGVTGTVSPQQIVGGNLLFNVPAVGVFFPTKVQLDTFFNNQKNISFNVYLQTTSSASIAITLGVGTTFASSGGINSGMASNLSYTMTYTCNLLGIWQVWFCTRS